MTETLPWPVALPLGGASCFHRPTWDTVHWRSVIFHLCYNPSFASNLSCPLSALDFHSLPDCQSSRCGRPSGPEGRLGRVPGGIHRDNKLTLPVEVKMTRVGWGSQAHPLRIMPELSPGDSLIPLLSLTFPF